MNLNEAQKQEIAAYIRDIAAYSETYNELYDHILSAISLEGHETFSMNVVDEIITEDFGGISKIKLEEANHQKELNQRFFDWFRREMVNTFKFPAIIGNLATLAFCYLIYSGEAAEETKIKVLLVTFFILALTPILLYVVKVYIIDRNQMKPSINNPALKSLALLGMSVANAVYFVFLQRDSVFSFSSGIKYFIMFGICFIMGIYIRTYLKMYNNTLKLKVQ